jgi:glutathione S-transferase
LADGEDALAHPLRGVIGRHHREDPMSLTLYFHPFSSYCQKALIALYENETPFAPRPINLADPADAAALKALWGVRKFPVLRDEARAEIVPESSIIIEYLAQHYPGRSKLIPADGDAARRVRLLDRFFDFYVSDQVSKIVTDAFRPAGQHDALGVEQARATLRNSYDILEQQLEEKTWATGASFTLADCAAAPSLFYANLILPLHGHGNTTAYLDRLLTRPSFARALKEARPTLMASFPYHSDYIASYERSLRL